MIINVPLRRDGWSEETSGEFNKCPASALVCMVDSAFVLGGERSLLNHPQPSKIPSCWDKWEAALGPSAAGWDPGVAGRCRKKEDVSQHSGWVGVQAMLGSHGDLLRAFCPPRPLSLFE